MCFSSSPTIPSSPPPLKTSTIYCYNLNCTLKLLTDDFCLPLLSSNPSRSPPTSKRIKTSVSTSAPSPSPHHHHLLLAQQQQQQQQQLHPYSRSAPFEGIPMSQAQVPPPLPTTTNSRKRRSSLQSGSTSTMAGGPVPTTAGDGGEVGRDPGAGTSVPEHTPKKKGRTNTPWTAEEEQRLKTMRDAGRSWGEIAKVCLSTGRNERGKREPSLTQFCRVPFAFLLQTFPNRTEGSVKKHWYKVRIPFLHFFAFELDNSSY